MPQAQLVFNPHAGRFPARPLLERAAQVLEADGWNIEIHETHSGEHLSQLALAAAETGMDAVFVAGGDGSIEHAVEGLSGSDTALGVLPIGTANVWAQELGLPIPNITHWTALEQTARRLARGRVRGVDVGRCNGKPFLLWAGVGLDAFIVHNIEPRESWQKLLGAGLYAAQAVATATAWKGITLQIQVDGRALDDHYLMVVMSNIRLYAGGLARLSPDAILDDGLMELWLFQGDSPTDALRHARDLLTGAHMKSQLVQRIQTSRLRMAANRPIPVQLDGEPFEPGREVEIGVHRRALKILVPADTSEALFSV